MRRTLNLHELPVAIGLAVDKLLAALGNAETHAQVEREAAIQMGFVLGLETARYLRRVDIEQLYLMFEDAVDARLNLLQGRRADADQE